MECKLFVLCFCLSLINVYLCMDQASFYGNSYISLPSQEASSSTNISFKFRTLLPNALVLLVAGTTDYCIIRLENGRIKININLGAGESELVSPRSLKFNDFKWHQVSILRREANLSLSIDNSHPIQKLLPGRFFELNIHYGLFVGGHGNFSEIFFGHLDNFRGCLSQLNYNGMPVLEQARLRQSNTIVQHVTWNCAAEFGATVDQPISFVEDDAFMMIPQSFSGKEIRIKFDIKTMSSQGVLFYNSGHGMKLDFFLVEIWKRNIICIIKSETKHFELVHEENISDGHWHKVFIHVSSTLVQITVDGKTKSDKNVHGHVFQFSDSSYIGGLEANKRSRAMSKGCKYCDTTFKGCIRHLGLYDVKKGLPDAHVTLGILAGCVWEYPCSEEPCKDGGVCVQQGLDSFQCQCQEEFCVKNNYTEGYKVFSKNSLATELQILSVERLEVLEGQSTIISLNNLHMVLDYQKYGILDSGVTFHIVEGPLHGSVAIDRWPHEKNIFYLSDVAKDKVHYVHDGSEYHQDIIVLEIEFFQADTFILPEYLQGRFRFSLAANVLPVNDLPVLDGSDTTVIRVVQGTKKVIDSTLLKVKDPDNAPEQIVYNILESPIGHFEYAKKEGHKITSFTHKDVEDEKIVFVHDSNVTNDLYVALQLSDGIETSPVTKIRVSVSPQYWRMENNTGIVVLHNTATIITPFNLSFISNAESVDHQIQVQIVKKPNFGVIEVEKSANSWEKSLMFFNADLKQHRVRYRHINGKPDFDEFEFRLNMDKSPSYTFRITFAACTLLNNIKTDRLMLNGSWEISLSSQHLSFQTSPIKVQTTSIHYVLTSVPVYGYLFSSVSKYRLRSCDTFTQEDVKLQNIKYKLIQKPFSYVQDSFTFVVLSPGCSNTTRNFTFIYHPPIEFSSNVTLISKPLKVDEGSSGIIDLSHLNIITNLIADLQFNITEKPKFGFLQIKTNEILRNNTDWFTLSEMKMGLLHYKNDGSENENDDFTFMALAKNEQDFLYVNTFKIDIVLKNDNSPVRTIDQVFHVVVGGERLLTGKDLKYVDADLNTKISEIVYTCRDSPNGNFYYVSNQSFKITTEFSQQDLDNHRILFKHRGPEYAKVRLWVTDGQFHINGVLEVQASAPFVHPHTRKKLVVKQGSSAMVGQEHLSYSTNVFASDSDVIYEIVTPPNFGQITSSDFRPITSFTQADVNKGDIYYMNRISHASADEIGLRVKCKDAVNVVQLGVWLLPSNYWEPFKIKHLNQMSVEESTSAIITKNILEISQLNVPSSAITYYIKRPPDNGYITVLSDSKNTEYELINVQYFTQEQINENRVLYIQSVSNQSDDFVILNVTNGMIWHNNVQMKIEIIPEQIYITSKNLTVNEGGFVTLTVQHLVVLTKYYRDKIKDFVILQDAKYGCVQIHKRCNKFNGFSYKELIAGIVNYAHDGSEQHLDTVTLTGVANKKQSVPIVLTINVVPINNQKPKLVNNTGLIMWEGGDQEITNIMLAATDEDKPGDTLRYQVLNSWWGGLFHKTDPSTTVSSFTQEMIDSKLIVFHHQNGSEAKFRFNINDGLHTTEEYTFHVKTKQVELRVCSKPLHIFPLQRKYLTSSHLFAIISDPNRDIFYEVTTAPALGRLMMESATAKGIFQVVSTFTQSDLNNSRIFYEHTHQFSDLYANDSFVFNVRAHLALTLRNQVLKIDISVSSGGLDAYVAIPKVSVDEGGIASITLNLSGVVTFLENHAGLRAPIIHAATTNPQYGQIFLKHNRNITTFTQQQLESGQVYYEHDHSDTLGDNIHFAFYLIPGYIPLCNVTVPVLVNPINDQSFVLVTPAPSLTVVQGENRTITRNELATEDADTPPLKIKYTVITGPYQGKLVLLPNKIPVISFTQADIDNNLLVYVHNSSVLKDSFHVRVWDESFRPEFTLFNVIVLPVNLTINSGFPVYLQQGSDVVFLNEKQFVIETNANIDKVRYRIKREPKHGALYVKDIKSAPFSQLDLKNDNVMYLQTDMTTANDSFQLIGEITTGNTSIGNEIEVNVKVQPLMQIRNLTAISGQYNKLTLNVIDATPLAKLTNSNPRYTVTYLPRYVQVRKVIRSSGEKRNILNSIVGSFYHEEVQSGLIYLVVDNFEPPWGGLNDRIEFLLAASIFQPAFGDFKITIKSALNNEIHSTLAGPNDPAGHEGGLHFASPNMTRDYFLIVSMVTGVVVLGVAVIVIIKCRSLDAEEMNKEEQYLQPIPLPRPPGRLLTSSPSPPPVKSQLDGFSSLSSTALPHCKVTPLSRNEMESNACYPYGVDEHSDDWSSCDNASDPTCPTKNIMLRRNQYWV